MATATLRNAAQISMPPIKNLCEWFEPPMGAVTAFTQLRTDTTLDLSQKAEKVWIDSQSDAINSFEGDYLLWVLPFYKCS